jgi:Putative transposase
MQVAATPRHLGARLGFLAILHTWGQNLLHHPHLHCVVPAGGLAADGSRWIPCRPGFFLPVRVLSRLFRAKFLDLLVQAYRDDELEFHGQLRKLQPEPAFRAIIARLRGLEWVVYAKPPFGGPEGVLKYLARYTHRIAISNHRLLSATDAEVSFSWKDYKHGHRQRVMTLDIEEFVRRFLLHVLPTRFVKIRYYGLLAQSQRTAALPLCARLVDAATDSVVSQASPPAEPVAAFPYADSCPICERGHLYRVRTLQPNDTS